MNRIIKVFIISLLLSFYCSFSYAATYYADFDLGTGLNDGTSAANAWRTMQRAVDGTGGTQPTAGDIVYCKGTDTLAANLDLDGSSGGLSTGFVQWIGVSALTPTNDGTRAVIDGGDTYTCTATTTDYWFMENFEFIQMSTSGVVCATSPAFWVWINCSFNNNGTHGMDTANIAVGHVFIRCTFYLNATDGTGRTRDCKFIFCSIHDNTGDGFNSGQATLRDVIGCLIYDNGDDAIPNVGSGRNLIMNTVIDGNAGSGITNADFHFVIGCRITNHSTASEKGIDAIGRAMFHGWNYFEDNDGANIQNAGFAIEITHDGASTDVEDQADTNEGYTDRTDGSEDFSLRDDATSRRTAITIPLN